MHQWINALADHQSRGEACVLVTIIEERGSTPRNAGSKMVVSASGLFDTIGGGHLEYKALHIARQMLEEQRTTPHLERFSLAPAGPVLRRRHRAAVRAHGRRAGADSRVRRGPCRPGSGTLARRAACRVRWIDSREQEFPELIPNGVTKVVSEEPVDEVADLPPGCYCIVMTHNHQLDLELTAAILKRNDFTWFGLIGSKTKRVKFEHRLRERGYDEAVLARMRCPMGLPEVKGKLPIEIAVSIAGEIIATYNACFGQHDAAANAGPIAQLLPPSRRSQAI